MIFKDLVSGKDRDIMPEDRGAACVNCGLPQGKHAGWACLDLPFITGAFSALNRGEYYLTAGMLASIGLTLSQWYTQYPYRGVTVAPATPIPNDAPAAARITLSTSVKVTEPEDTSRDWRAWRRSTPGECLCGSTPGICPFHQ